MNIATGSIVNTTSAGHDWVVALDGGDDTVPEVICPVVAWAIVVDAHLTDGTATTSIQPAFLHLDMVWTPAELREHAPEVRGFEIRARIIPGAAAHAARLKEWEEVLAPRPAHEAGERSANPDYRA